MQAVILCGGLATRLYPITKTIPKSLILIDKVPFISYQLDVLYTMGVRDAVLCVGKHGKQIEDYVEDGSFWGINVKYSYENENNLLGTGGAIKNALDLLQDNFIILYGDSYLDVDLEPIIKKFKSENKSMLMTVYKNENMYGKSNILYEKGRILKYSKKNITPDMKHIEYGITIAKKAVFSKYNQEKFDLADLMSELIFYDNVSTYEVFTRFYEIGSFSGIQDLKTFLNK